MQAGDDEGFAESIDLWRFRRDTDAVHPDFFPEGVELAGEFGVAVVDQVFCFDAVVVEPYGHVPGLLHQPGLVGVEGRLAHVNPTVAQMQEDQNIGVDVARAALEIFHSGNGGHASIYWVVWGYRRSCSRDPFTPDG